MVSLTYHVIYNQRCRLIRLLDSRVESSHFKKISVTRKTEVFWTRLEGGKLLVREDIAKFRQNLDNI